MNVRSLSIGPLDTNCYVVLSVDAQRAVVIDPGTDPDRVVDVVARAGATVEHILLTHGHFDHVAAARFLACEVSAPISIHAADAPMLDLRPPGPPWTEHFRLNYSIDHYLSDGELLALAGYSWQVLHTPGHSPGGVCLLVDGTLFAGDTLFAGSIGRCDLPGGDERQLLKSIRVKLLALPDETLVLPGHGPTTTIGTERARNPWLQNLRTR